MALGIPIGLNGSVLGLMELAVSKGRQREAAAMTCDQGWDGNVPRTVVTLYLGPDRA